MSETLIVCRQFEADVDGQHIDLPRPILATERAYAKHLRRRAVEDLAADLRDAPRELHGLYVDLRRDLANSITAGHFDWLAPGFWESLGSPLNKQALIYHWLDQARPGAFSEEKVAELWPSHQDEFDRLINEVLNDPNRGAARKGAANGSTSSKSGPSSATATRATSTTPSS